MESKHERNEKSVPVECYEKDGHKFFRVVDKFVEESRRLRVSNGVHLKECLKELKEKSFCIVDLLELDIDISEFNEWKASEDEALNKTIKEKIRKKLNQECLFNGALKRDNYGLIDPVFGVVTHKHEDNGYVGNDLKVWIPFDDGKSLLLWQSVDEDPIISGKGKAVIFWSYPEEIAQKDWKARACTHGSIQREKKNLVARTEKRFNAVQIPFTI